jgi:hypothetical protein
VKANSTVWAFPVNVYSDKTVTTRSAIENLLETTCSRFGRLDCATVLLHTVLRVPAALLFANEDNLADVVRIVCTDVREHLGGLL